MALGRSWLRRLAGVNIYSGFKTAALSDMAPANAVDTPGHYYVSPLESCGASGVSDSSYYSLSVLKSSKWEVRERGKGKVWYGQLSTCPSWPVGLSGWLQ